MSATPDDDRLLTKRDIATLFGCTIRTVERMVQAGRLPVIHISTGGSGWRLRFHAEAINALLAEGKAVN